MPVGKSGRIVIEIDPELKQELYLSLGQDESNLKNWFLGCRRKPVACPDGLTSPSQLASSSHLVPRQHN